MKLIDGKVENLTLKRRLGRFGGGVTWYYEAPLFNPLYYQDSLKHHMEHVDALVAVLLITLWVNGLRKKLIDYLCKK